MLSDWYLVVSGDPADIGLLEELLRSSSEHVIERDGQTKQWRLRSTRLRGIPDHETAHETAQEVLTQLADAAAAVAGTRIGLSIGSLGRTRPDGHSDVFVFAQPAVITARALPPTVLINGQVVGEPPADRILRLQTAHPDLRLAIHLLNLPESWFDLYKAFEVIRSANGEEPGLLTKKWTSRAAIRRFRGTANARSAVGDAARHASKAYRPPPRPMTLREADEFVRGLLARWLEIL